MDNVSIPKKWREKKKNLQRSTRNEAKISRKSSNKIKRSNFSLDSGQTSKTHITDTLKKIKIKSKIKIMIINQKRAIDTSEHPQTQCV